MNDRVVELYLAASAGNEDLLAKLLSEDVDVNNRHHGVSALHQAAMYGHPSIIRLLHQAGADMQITTPDGVTPLHLAGVMGQTECAQLLIQLGSERNLLDSKGTSPIDWAALNGFISTLGTEDLDKAIKEYDFNLAIRLIAYGVDTEILDQKTWRELCLFAAGSQNKNTIEVNRILLEKYNNALFSNDDLLEKTPIDELFFKLVYYGAKTENISKQKWSEVCYHAAGISYPKSDGMEKVIQSFDFDSTYLDKDGNPCFHALIEKNNDSNLKYLIDNLQIKGISDSRNKLGNTPIMQSIIKRSHNCFEQLVKNFDFMTGYLNNDNDTTLHLALKSKDENIIKSLIMKGVSKDCLRKNNDFITPIELAKYDDNIFICLLMKFLGYFVKTKEGLENGDLLVLRNSLIHAASLQHFSTIENLLKILIEHIEETGSYSVSMSNDRICMLLEIMNILLENVTILGVDEEGNTPLHHAVLNSDTVIIKSLIDNGAGPSFLIKNLEGKSPLGLSMLKSNLAETFYKDDPISIYTEGQNYDDVSNPKLLFEITKIILEKLDIEGFDDEGNTLLHLAAKYDDKPMIQFLLSYENVNMLLAKNKEGKIPSENGSDVVFKAMIECSNGNTPLHYAVQLCDSDMISHILKIDNASFSLNHLNNDKCTPLHLALESEDLKKSDLLKMMENGSLESFFIEDSRGKSVLERGKFDDSYFDIIFSAFLRYCAEPKDEVQRIWGRYHNKIREILLHAATLHSFVTVRSFVTNFVETFFKDDDGFWIDKPMFEVLKIVLEKKDIIETDDDGNTPLHVSTRSTNDDLTKFLLVNGAAMSQMKKNKEGKIPLNMAKEKKETEHIYLALAMDFLSFALKSSDINTREFQDFLGYGPKLFCLESDLIEFILQRGLIKEREELLQLLIKIDQIRNKTGGEESKKRIIQILRSGMKPSRELKECIDSLGQKFSWTTGKVALMSTISILKNIVLGGFLYGFDIYTDIFFANEMMNNFKNYVTLTTEYEECKMKKAESISFMLGACNNLNVNSTTDCFQMCDRAVEDVIKYNCNPLQRFSNVNEYETIAIVSYIHVALPFLLMLFVFINLCIKRVIKVDYYIILRFPIPIIAKIHKTITECQIFFNNKSKDEIFYEKSNHELMHSLDEQSNLTNISMLIEAASESGKPSTKKQGIPC